MEQDDGFCGSCGAIIDADLLDAETDDEPKTTPNLTAPLADLAPDAEGSNERHAVPGALDLGAFDEHTDVGAAPPDAPPPPAGAAPRCGRRLRPPARRRGCPPPSRRLRRPWPRSRRRPTPSRRSSRSAP